MAAIEEDRLGNEDVDASNVDEEDSQEDEFADEDAEVSLPEFDEDVDGDATDIDEVVELTSKEQSARTLEIRRAIEERMEQRQLHEDLDYLDLDEDD